MTFMPCSLFTEVPNGFRYPVADSGATESTFSSGNSFEAWINPRYGRKWLIGKGPINRP
jgi:hypothetical protein